MHNEHWGHNELQAHKIGRHSSQSIATGDPAAGRRMFLAFHGTVFNQRPGFLGLSTIWADPPTAYFSPFLGQPPTSAVKLLDDRALVNMNGGGRKLVKIQLWCGGDTVYSMIPWYEGKIGSKDSRHWQYAKNAPGGVYKELILGPNEYVTQVIYDTCPTLGGSKLCFIAIRKGTTGGPQTGVVTCGTARHTAPYQSKGYPK